MIKVEKKFYPGVVKKLFKISRSIIFFYNSIILNFVLAKDV